MKITLQNLNEISEENYSFEKFKTRNKKFTLNQTVNKIMTDEGSNYSFRSEDLEELRGKAIVDELICIIKSGKEATVYLGKRDDEYLAVKIYTELRLRSFRNDNIYTQGRFIGDDRIEKAITKGSETGLNAHQILWVSEEFRQMKYFYDEGIPVPKPVASSGLVVVMEFIGEEGIAAQRLSDLSLEKSEAEEAFNQSLRILELITRTGRIHGDLSSYNILWHNEKAIVIDFPQVVSYENNNSAKELLRRDVSSLCKSFKKYKIIPDELKIFNAMKNILSDTRNW